MEISVGKYERFLAFNRQERLAAISAGEKPSRRCRFCVDLPQPGTWIASHAIVPKLVLREHDSAHPPGAPPWCRASVADVRAQHPRHVPGLRGKPRGRAARFLPSSGIAMIQISILPRPGR
ncbi:hypothetical protein Herbaro_02230 [Herbaspirillum sp. WKF16]|uniref:hypothetical protein n=1 Tax=Herbaspirillum sp. WKF16 TaxID=3028312 RepID=UPI0023AA0917|nr:hypothetical protein [Herbaspirillum sp. WKF16]WDZ96622.1 hypothetical protein Herbaro_02230 [Herbaspirillum sp. WKF16]